VFLASYVKDRRGKVSQYREPIFGDPDAFTSVAPEVNINEEVDDPYPTHADYAKMLHYQRTISDNNLMTVVNMLMTRMDRLEGKTVNFVDASANE